MYVYMYVYVHVRLGVRLHVRLHVYTVYASLLELLIFTRKDNVCFSADDITPSMSLLVQSNGRFGYKLNMMIEDPVSVQGKL